jgi:predicted Zn-ribbon and HTH transcriptional regulator
MAFCPCHADGAKHGRRSLHVQEKNGKLLLYCFAGCRYEDIKHALGLDQWEQGHGQEPEAVYDYRDENGKLLYQVLRYPGKQFKQRRPDGAGGWTWNLKGVVRTLYRLPELLVAVQAGEVIFVVEGEKDADNLRRIGLTATTCSGGAGKWESRFNNYLAGASVVILPDNDEPGQQHAKKVAESLQGKAKSIKIVKLPGLPDKGDVSDWLAAGGTREELLRLVAETPEWKPPKPANCFTAAELLRMEFPDPVWCVSGILPEGLTILAGKPKIGKSWMALNLAVAVASGGVFLGESVDPAQVLYFALEDTPRRLKDRLLSVLSGDPAPERLYFYTGLPQLDDGGLVLLEAEIIKRKPKLVIIDTLQRIRGVHKGNSTAYQVDYEEIAALKQIADRHGVALVLIHHLKKAAEVDPLDMVSGSVGISGAADAVWVLTRERGQTDATLYAVGRDFEERELALRLDPTITTWQLLGDAEEYRMSKERREILKVLKEADAPLRPKEVAELLGKRYDTVAKTLQRMAKEGTIVKDNYGKYSYLSSPTCPTCPSSTEMNPKIGLGHELGQQLGHSSDPQTRINTELGQDGQLGHMDSNLNVQPDGLGHPNESGVQTWDDPDDGKLPRERLDPLKLDN